MYEGIYGEVMKYIYRMQGYEHLPSLYLLFLFCLHPIYSPHLYG